MSAYKTTLNLLKLNKNIENEINEILIVSNISLPEWLILGIIKDEENPRINDIAQIYNVDSPFITSVINKLEEKELVKKNESKEDGRSKIITLTAKSKKILATLELNAKKTHTLSKIPVSAIKSLEKII